jgi:hypothetical protein
MGASSKAKTNTAAVAKRTGKVLGVSRGKSKGTPSLTRKYTQEEIEKAKQGATPAHYKKNWTWFITEHLTFSQGCVMKRLVRLGLKDKPLFDLYKIQKELESCERYPHQQMNEKRKLQMYGDFRQMMSSLPWQDSPGSIDTWWLLPEFIEAVLADDFEKFSYEIKQAIFEEENQEIFQ